MSLFQRFTSGDCQVNSLKQNLFQTLLCDGPHTQTKAILCVKSACLGRDYHLEARSRRKLEALKNAGQENLGFDAVR
jgi:hypothetical protein